jgi:hypothetical protein
MLMVNVQPKLVSTAHDPDEPVATNGEIDIYLGPGTNYAVLSTMNGNGIILDSHKELEGVWAKGAFWWKVDFDGDGDNVVDGWVREGDISQQLKFLRLDGFKIR